jgi:hypothetical protein
METASALVNSEHPPHITQAGDFAASIGPIAEHLRGALRPATRDRG